MSIRRSLTVFATVALVAAALFAVTGARTANAATAPSFTVFTPPAAVGGTDAGEPSVGVDHRTGRVLMQAGVQTLQVTVAGTSATWKDVSPTLTSLLTLDPILATDSRTGRTFVSELAGACSLMAYTDTDGEASALPIPDSGWVQNPLGCGAGAAFDHQTVGAGPFAAPLTGTVYPDAVYYCAQAVASAQCARSDDGGLTFGPGVPIYTALDCGGLHGHIKVAPDGTAYVPNASCTKADGTNGQGVAYSTDNGLTWKVSTVPDSSTQQESDPSVGISKGGVVYFGYADGSGRPRVAVGHKDTAGNLTWSASSIVDSAIANTQFPTVVAGNDDRAAIAFLGTTTPGDDQSSSFAGVWHLYVATTYDGGATWTTTDATPTDPVQRGCIWLGGGSNQ
ncbi:MAG TPA: sialidase family protein, partial [Acidimicrobiales bacterium]|nr:sialidase family protein [Acidimicrobiales bacterium]